MPNRHRSDMLALPLHRSALPRLAAVAVLVLALVATLAAPSTAGSSEERRLQQTQAKITEVRKQIEAAKAQRSTEGAALAEAERQLATVMEAVNAAELAVQRQQEAVAGARAELDRLEEAHEHQQRLMGKRAAALYRQGTGVPMAAVLAADNVEEALIRSTYVEIVTRADLEQFQGIETSQVAIDAQRRNLEAEEETLERVLVQQQAIMADVAALRDERAMVLAGSTEKLRELEAQERHLESESRQVAALARRASQAATGASRSQSIAAPGARGATAAAAPVGTSAAGWTWPARGPVTSEFGRRWGRMHDGIDIGAGTGAAVVAARAGRVSHVGSMGGYGNLILVDHGGGIATAYAHLSAYAASAGQQVSAGQRIASVGCTGSCTGPHLHFEVRVNGTPRNPRNYLP